MKNIMKLLLVLLLQGLCAFPYSAHAAVPDYTIGSGDVLQITVWKEETLDREILVLPDGTIDFPLVGSFKVVGMTPAQVQQTLKRKLQNFIPDASVVVVVKAPLGHSVSVIGQVTKPGEYVMSHRLTVMQALSQAGGLTPYASEDDIIILRHEDGQEISIPFPYDKVVAGRDLDKDIRLNAGDVVVVPTASLF
jgi:polysaccharide export outer membrane protein